MKILIVVFNYFPSVGGTQIFFQRLAEEFVKSYNDDVTVFTTDSLDGPDKKAYRRISPSKEVINGVKVYRFSFIRIHKPLFRTLNKICRRLFNHKSVFINERLIGPWSPSLERAIDKYQGDLIIASSSTFLYMHYPLTRLKRKNPKPFIFQGAIHFEVNSNKIPLTDKTVEAIRKCDIYWSNSVYEKLQLTKQNVFTDKIFTIGCAVDADRFSLKAKNIERENKSEIVIGYVGRIESFKSIHVLLDALPTLYQKFSNFKVVIAGRKSQYSKKLKEIVRELPGQIAEKVCFIEDFSENEKADLYHSFDMIVLPSLNESFGIVFLEAWACKKPVIGANIGAVASVIANKKDGLLFEPDNACDLAAKIFALTDTQFAQQLGQAGYQKVMKNYTWSIVTEKARKTCFEAIKNFNEILPQRTA